MAMIPQFERNAGLVCCQKLFVINNNNLRCSYSVYYTILMPVSVIYTSTYRYLNLLHQGVVSHNVLQILLQKSISQITKWTKNNNISLNVKKPKRLAHVILKCVPVHHFNQSYPY